MIWLVLWLLIGAADWARTMWRFRHLVDVAPVPVIVDVLMLVPCALLGPLTWLLSGFVEISTRKPR